MAQSRRPQAVADGVMAAIAVPAMGAAGAATAARGGAMLRRDGLAGLAAQPPPSSLPGGAGRWRRLLHRGVSRFGGFGGAGRRSLPRHWWRLASTGSSGWRCRHDLVVPRGSGRRCIGRRRRARTPCATARLRRAASAQRRACSRQTSANSVSPCATSDAASAPRRRRLVTVRCGSRRTCRSAVARVSALPRPGIPSLRPARKPRLFRRSPLQRRRCHAFARRRQAAGPRAGRRDRRDRSGCGRAARPARSRSRRIAIR